MQKLIKPFKGNYRVTLGFGKDPDGYPGYYKQYGLLSHNGIDYATPIGTPLLAAIDGNVIEVAFDEHGYGWYVHIENADMGVLTGHMSETSVKVGFTVNQGDPIGLSGNTGKTLGAHVHFGFYTKPRNRSNGYNGYIDPEKYLAIGDTMEVKTLNTWGLDDTNLDSKQVVYNTWHDVASGKYVEIAKYNTLLDADTKLQLDEKDLQRMYNEKLEALTKILDKSGQKNVDDVVAMLGLYQEMAMAGFVDLNSIRAVIDPKDKQIKLLTEAVNVMTPTATGNIDLKVENAELIKQTALVNKDSVYNTIAQLLEKIKFLFKGHPKAEAIIAKVEEIQPAEVEHALNDWQQFNKYLKGEL